MQYFKTWNSTWSSHRAYNKLITIHIDSSTATIWETLTSRTSQTPNNSNNLSLLCPWYPSNGQHLCSKLLNSSYSISQCMHKIASQTYNQTYSTWTTNATNRSAHFCSIYISTNFSNSIYLIIESPVQWGLRRLMLRKITFCTRAFFSSMWLQHQSQPKQNINLILNHKDANWILNFSKINYLSKLSTSLVPS